MSDRSESITGSDGCLYVRGGSDLNPFTVAYYHDYVNCRNHHDNDYSSTNKLVDYAPFPTIY